MCEEAAGCGSYEERFGDEGRRQVSVESASRLLIEREYRSNKAALKTAFPLVWVDTMNSSLHSFITQAV